VYDRVGGTATLSPSGTLTIRGTLGSDALRTNLGPLQPGGAQDLVVRINDRPGQTFDLTSVRRVVVLAGEGNDQVALWSDVSDDNGLPIGLGGRPAFIDGGRGNDTLISENGIDVLNGGLGNDSLFGRDGNDRLFGGPGDDVLVGTAGGTDLVNGGPGTDTAQRDGTDQPVGIENDSIA
jgi:Ca2+-binding RTX toxin-like protein